MAGKIKDLYIVFDYMGIIGNKNERLDTSDV